jgi:rod shape-determining protein MreC
MHIVAVGAFAVLVIVTFIVLGQGHTTQRLQSGFLGMISPFLKQGSSLDRKYTEMRERVKTMKQLEEDNKRLTVANKDLSATNQTLRDMEAENNKLRNALGYRERSVFKLMPARIIARDASTWYQTVKIDRGSAEGVKKDMPVLTEEGLVGKTSIVSDHAATVILISDENCGVAANIEGSNEKGIVRGERLANRGLPAIGLGLLSKEANLKSGQKVYSSGVGGVFPSGVLIGVVKEFKVRELQGYASLVPAVDLTTIDDVFVVISGSK